LKTLNAFFSIFANAHLTACSTEAFIVKLPAVMPGIFEDFWTASCRSFTSNVIFQKFHISQPDLWHFTVSQRKMLML